MVGYRRPATIGSHNQLLKGVEVLASSYPLLDAFWTMLIFAGFFVWLWIAIGVFSDIFTSHDLSGWKKALWTVAIFLLPIFGVLLYLIVRGDAMRRHAAAQVAEQEAATKEYIRTVASGNGKGGASPVDELVKLLRDAGALSESEFQQAKGQLLARMG